VNEGAVPGVEIGTGSTYMALKFCGANYLAGAQDNLIHQLSKDRKILL